MAKVSTKDKLDAVLMYENGETLKVIAAKFNTSIPLVHYWKKNKEKLLKELEWTISPENNNQHITNNLQIKCKEERSSHVSNASQYENNQNVFLESSHIEVDNNLDEIQSKILNQFSVQRSVTNARKNVQKQISRIAKKSKTVESNIFKNVQNRLGPLINFQNQFNSFQNHINNNNYRNEFDSSNKKPNKINQNRLFVSGLSRVQQLQLKEYFSLKNVYDTQMESGEQLKLREKKNGNNSNDNGNSLADEIEEYNKVVNGDLFIKIIERLEHLETVLFYLID